MTALVAGLAFLTKKRFVDQAISLLLKKSLRNSLWAVLKDKLPVQIFHPCCVERCIASNIPE